MNAALFLLVTASGSRSALLAFVSPTLATEIAMRVAALATLLGVWLCWSSPTHRMSREKQAKDGLITAAEARRQVRCRSRLGPALVIAGLLALGWACGI